MLEVGIWMRWSAERRAVVLLIVRRWCRRISPLSSEARDSISERGISSSSFWESSSESCSSSSSFSELELSVSLRRDVSI